MRKTASLLAVGLLAGAISIGTGSPAHAQDECSAQDPILAFVCDTIGDIPDAGPTVQYYYDLAGRTVKTVYCRLWSDPTCP